MFDYFPQREPLDLTVKIMLIVWCVLLIPWFAFALVAGMAFDGGPTAAAYIVVWDVFTYPIAVGISFYYRRKHTRLIWLPAVNLVLPIVAALDAIWKNFSN